MGWEDTINQAFSSWTDTDYSNYAPVADAVITPVTSDGGGFWDMMGRYANNTSDWLDKHEGLMKWGAAGVGGLASYLSALEYNKRAEEARGALAAEKAARTAEAKQLGASRNFSLARARTPALSQPGLEGVFFKNNALSANPSTVEGYADGGMVQQQFAPEYYNGGQLNFAAGGEVPGYAQGGLPGQSDKIPAMLSDGEFVFDADTVAALGDGNNAAGASALEKMRQNIRRHKRSAPVDKIPPKAKKPEAYMKKGKK